MARRVTLTQMGFLNYAPSEEFESSSNDHDDESVDEFATLPLIDLDLLGQGCGNANQPVLIDVDSEVEVEDLEESELIDFGTQLTQHYDFNEVLEEESKRAQQSENPSPQRKRPRITKEELIDFGSQLTQEYDVNEVLEEESKREQQSDEPSLQQKRPRVTEQPKINGYLVKSDIAPKMQFSMIQDSTPKWHLPNGRLFKKGETFKLLGGNGIYVTIDKVVTKNLHLEVVSGTGGVSVLLTRTFIGETESKRLLQAKSWLEQNPKHPDKALYANRSKLFAGGTISLNAMSFKLENLTQRPEPALVYDCGPKASSGVGSNFAYRRDSRRSHAKRELPRKPVVVDLFAGGGGMGQGFKEAGFYCRYNVEKDYSAVATLQCNHQLDGIFGEEAIIFDEDVETFLQKVHDKDPAYPQMGDVDHVHASPPCQGFSFANRNGGRNDKNNNELTKIFTKAVEIFRPRTASLENVTGMLSKKNNNVDYLKWVIAELMILGYQVRVTVLNSAEFGDPQVRNRVILFAAQNAYKLPDAPKPTHGQKGEKAIVTVKDVLHDLEDVKPVRGSGRVVLPSGKIVLDHNEEGTDLATMGLLDENKPAATVRKSNGIQHYALPRGLTVRERARIQSFPDHYVFCGRTTDRNDQIGNAVPLNLARAVASSIMESHILGAAPDSGV
jgi:DNA (cytosine-5)-methyltransferase 1